MRVFGGEKIAQVMERLGVDDETPIENRFISKSLEGAQKKVEGYNFDARKNVVKYDDVMNRHRRATYVMRRDILHETDIKKRIKVFIEEESQKLADSPLLTTDKFESIVTHVFPLDEDSLDRLFDTDADRFHEALVKEAYELYDEKEFAFTPEAMRKIERDVYLQILDNLWMQHLENMDHLREGIHWISVGQRDPLVEYRRQGQRLFEEMQSSLRHDVLRSLFHAQPIDKDSMAQPVETELTRAARNSVSNAKQIQTPEEHKESQYVSKKKATQNEQKKQQERKKARKAERQRKKAKRRK